MRKSERYCGGKTYEISEVRQCLAIGYGLEKPENPEDNAEETKDDSRVNPVAHGDTYGKRVSHKVSKVYKCNHRRKK